MEEKKKFQEPEITFVIDFDADISCISSSADVDVKDDKSFGFSW